MIEDNELASRSGVLAVRAPLLFFSPQLRKEIFCFTSGRSEPLQRYTKHPEEVSALLAPPDSSVFISGSVDGSVKAWNIKTGQDYFDVRVNETNGSVAQPSPVHVLGLYKDLLVVGSAFSIDVFDMAGSARLVHRLHSDQSLNATQDPSNPCHAMYVQDNGRVLCGVGASVFEYDVSSGKRHRVFAAGADAGVVLRIFMAKEQIVVVHGRGVFIYARHAGEPKLLRSLDVDNAQIQCASAHGTHLVLGLFDTRVHVFDINTGAIVATCLGHTEPASDVFASASGVFSASWDGTIRSWDLSNGECSRSIAVQQAVQAVYVADGSVYSGDLLAMLTEYDAATGKVKCKHEGKVSLHRTVAIHGNTLLSSYGYESFKLMAHDVSTGKHLRTYDAFGDVTIVFHVQVWQSRNIVFASDSDGRVLGLNIDTGAVVYECPTSSKQAVYHFLLNEDTSRLYTASVDKSISVFDLQADGKAVLTHSWAGSHTGAVTWLQMAQDRKWLYSSSQDRRLMRHSLTDLTEPGKVVVDVADDEVVGLLLCMNDTLLAVIKAHSTSAFVYDVATWRLKYTLAYHTLPVYRMAARDHILVTGSSDTNLALWDLRSGTLVRSLHDHTSPIRSIAFDETDGRLVTSSAEVITYDVSLLLRWGIVQRHRILSENKLERRVAHYGNIGLQTLFVMILVVDFLQLTAFPFTTDVPVSDTGFGSTLRYLQTFGLQEINYYLALAATLGCVGLFLLMFFTQEAVEMHKFLNPGSRLEYLWIFMSVSLKLLSRPMFLPLVRMMLRAFDCTYHSNGKLYLDAFLGDGSRIECWKGNHIIYASLSAVAMVLYLPLAYRFLRVGSKLEYVEFRLQHFFNWSTDRFFPRWEYPLSDGPTAPQFLLTVVTIKVLLSCITVLATTRELLVSVVLLVGGVVMLLVSLLYPPYFSETSNRIRAALDVGIVYAYLISLLTVVLPTTAFELLIILYAALVIVLMLLGFFMPTISVRLCGRRVKLSP